MTTPDGRFSHLIPVVEAGRDITAHEVPRVLWTGRCPRAERDGYPHATYRIVSTATSRGEIDVERTTKDAMGVSIWALVERPLSHFVLEAAVIALAAQAVTPPPSGD